MNIIKNIDLIWLYSLDTKYQFDKKGNCYNTHTGRQIKRTLIGYTIGYCLNGKFKSLEKISEKLEKIQKYKYPF